jgi:thioredoxin 1
MKRWAPIVLLALIVVGCSKTAPTASGSGTAAIARNRAAVVTFIELGSVECVPCKAMQPVMEEVRQRYGDQVDVVFHDVWTKEGEPAGQAFGIKLIPTQVFLDKNGKEYFRHEGFFPAEDLFKVLAQGGVKL